MSDNVLPEWLVNYVAQRDQERADAVNVVLSRLTERERHLVKEAAVMGYAQGRRHPQGADHPKDSAVTALVIQECLSFSDMYPVIATGEIPGLPCSTCGHAKRDHVDDDDLVTPGLCEACDDTESATCRSYHVNTADRAAARGLTPEQYREQRHEEAAQQIQTAVHGLRASVAVKVLAALDAAEGAS